VVSSHSAQRHDQTAPPFTQIAVVQTAAGPILYGLDHNGRVWFFDDSPGAWFRLSNLAVWE
jgi:hypothetical protein